MRAIFNNQGVAAHTVVDSANGRVAARSRGHQRDAVNVVPSTPIHIVNAVGDQRVIAFAPAEVVLSRTTIDEVIALITEQ